MNTVVTSGRYTGMILPGKLRTIMSNIKFFVCDALKVLVM